MIYNSKFLDGLKAPDDISTNVVWKLPSQDGTSDQVLTTDGNKNLLNSNLPYYLN